MSQLSPLLGVNADTQTLPGYTLATGQSLGQVADFEDYLAARDRSVAILAGEMVSLAQAQRLLATSEAKAAKGMFAYGTEAFEQAKISYSHAHGLLWANLRTHQPHVTLREAAALLTADNTLAVRRVILTAWGMTLRSDADPKAPSPPAVPSGGDPSSTSSFTNGG